MKKENEKEKWEKTKVKVCKDEMKEKRTRGIDSKIEVNMERKEKGKRNDLLNATEKGTERKTGRMRKKKGKMEK